MIKRAYNEKGVILVIATGRPLIYAKYISNEDGFNYIIASNGAIISDEIKN